MDIQTWSIMTTLAIGLVAGSTQSLGEQVGEQGRLRVAVDDVRRSVIHLANEPSPARQTAGESDCNDNGTFDWMDIENGTSSDCDDSGVPDECEVYNRLDYSFRVEPGAPLLDGVTTTRTYNVPETGDVIDIDLGLNLVHDYPGDLIISLSHGGVTVDLYYYGPCTGCPATCGMQGTIFDDEAPTAIPCVGMNAGVYYPHQSLTAFDGMDASGEWTLEIFDGFVGYEGQLDGWSLAIKTATGNDCNGNSLHDACDVESGGSADCNGDGFLDECELEAGAADCNQNGVPDRCEVGLDGQSVDQWASEVLDFSSQYSAFGYSAAQALGPPNTPQYGDYGTAWAPSSYNGTIEFLSVGFDTPVYAEGVTIVETYGNGFVYRVEVVDMAGRSHLVWTGNDPSEPGAPVYFRVNWERTAFPVMGVTIHVDTNSQPDAWEEIDAIQMHGVPVLIPDCNINGVPDECDLAAGHFDCNANGIPDDCDIAPLGYGVNMTANEVIDVTSEFNSTPGTGLALYALGLPDVAAWAPLERNGNLEHITVGFNRVAYATGVTIREYGGHGFVYKVDLLDNNNTLRTIWEGVDPSTSSSSSEPVDFELNWPITSYPVFGVRVYVNTDLDLVNYEFIDSIYLRGNLLNDCNDNAVDDWCELENIDCNENGVIDYCDVNVPSDDCCTASNEPGCNNAATITCVCSQLPSCCNTAWTQECVNAIPTLGCGNCNGLTYDCNADGVPDECDVAQIGSSYSQWSSSLVEYSSESVDLGPASQAVGAPDGMYWYPSSMDTDFHYVEVGFTEPVYATGVTIREGVQAGGVYAVDLRDTQGLWHLSAWFGQSSGSGTDVDFTVTWPVTGYRVDAVRVRVNAMFRIGEWETVDAIQLHGNLGSDCNDNGIDDYCETEQFDCNGNGLADICDLQDNSHNCCELSEGPGCSDPDIEECLCKILPHCCSTIWDQACVDAVTEYNCGDCEFEEVGGDCNGNGVLDDCEMGDLNGDFATTVIDQNDLAPCMRGPNVSSTVFCEPADFNCDLDVDLDDWARFQNSIE